MRIAYVVQRDLSREDGVTKKIRAQISQWIARGHLVRLYVYGSSGELWRGFEGIEVEHYPHTRLPRRLVVQERMRRSVERWRPDLVYVRFGRYYPSLERMARRLRVVLENNSDDTLELGKTLAPHKLAIHRWGRHRLFRRIAGVVSVTHELAERVRPYGKPVLVLANGVEITGRCSLEAPKNARPRLVLLCSSSYPWHGLDQVMALARCREWDFDVIGNLASDPNDIQAANVRFHGHLGRAEYEPILASADVAIGTLALHRKGMREACPLKTREYLALGLPTIVGYRDTDFPDGAPFLLELPAEEGNVVGNLEAVDEFVMRWKGQRIALEQVEHLDYSVKERRRLEFFEQIVEARPT